MPYSVTIWRAIFVARSMSLPAPVGDVAGHDLLGDPPAHEHGEFVAQLLAGHQEPVLLGQGEGIAECPAARDDGDLVDLVGVRQHVGHHGVAALVVGDQPPLLLVHDPALPLGAGHHPVDGFLDLLHRDGLLVAAGGEQRGLVDRVGEIGAGEPGRAAGEHLEVDGRVERLASGVHAQDGLAALQVGPVDHDLAVEPAGPQQRGVEDVGPVRRGHEDDGGTLVEAVHLDEQLVERLLAFVVPAAEPRAALAADGVDLVDEHDRGRARLRLLEEVAHSRRPDAHEHLHEVGSRDREERHARFAGDRAGEQGLAGAGWTEEQHPRGIFAPIAWNFEGCCR